jgi:hypothetical protein
MPRFPSQGLVALAAAFAGLLLGTAALAQSENCSESARQEIEQMLADGASADDVAAIYGGCTKPFDPSASGSTSAAALAYRNNIRFQAFPWSTLYESLRSCGYHPQREELDCSIEQRQRFGYGGIGPAPGGSFWVTRFCYVDPPTGAILSHVSATHTNDHAAGPLPPYYFGAVVQPQIGLHLTPNLRQNVLGWAIMSWVIVPPNCFTLPFWGEATVFNFRLDP